MVYSYIPVVNSIPEYLTTNGFKLALKDNRLSRVMMVLVNP